MILDFLQSGGPKGSEKYIGTYIFTLHLITVHRGLNDTAAFTKTRGSPLYVCCLDAEKCFDSIWHSGLFYKLINTMPDI